MRRLPLFWFVFASAAVALSSSPETHAENWPAWRGPRADGSSAEKELPLNWSATAGVEWKAELPERGNSTPIVWGDKVFLTQAVGQRRTVICFSRKDGRMLWQEGTFWEGADRTHQTNPYCASSPVTDGERVIAWFGSAGLWCWDMNGKELWHAELGKQDHEWGYGSSPVLEGGVCYVNFGPGERSFLVAVDKKTGSELWKTTLPEPTVWEGSGAKQRWNGSWVTPLVWAGAEGKQLLLPTPGHLRSYDLQSGRELWSCGGLNPLCYANPLVVDGIIAAFGGFNGIAMGVKAGGSGDITRDRRAWRVEKNAQRIGSGVVNNGLIFMPNEPGTVQCIDPATGEILWQERPQVPSGRASTWSSLAIAGDRIYMVTQSSDTVVLRAGRHYELLAVNSLSDGLTNASPAFSNGQIFLRTHKHLWCIGERSGGSR